MGLFCVELSKEGLVGVCVLESGWEPHWQGASHYNYNYKILYLWFLSPPVHIAWWAHMHSFLSVRLSVTLLKIHISGSITLSENFTSTNGL